MKINKHPEITFLELFETENSSTQLPDYRKQIATIETSDIDKIISIAKEYKNKKVIDYCEQMKKLYKTEMNYFEFFYNLCTVIQRQRSSKNKYPMFRKIEEVFKADLELCFKYDEVFKQIFDFYNTIKILERQRKKLNEIKGEIDEGIFCDAIGEYIIDEKTNFNRYSTNYLPYWFSCS